MIDSSKDNPLIKFIAHVNREREEEETKKRAKQLGLSYADLMYRSPEPGAVGLVPKELVKEGRIFAFKKEKQNIYLALDNPKNPKTISALKTLINSQSEYTFIPVLVSKTTLDYLLSLYDTFAPEIRKTGDLKLISASKRKVKTLKDFRLFKDQLKKTSISELLERLLTGGAALNASDIHIEAEQNQVRLRIRLDGLLHDIGMLPHKYLQPLINRLKILADLKLNIHRAAQDGRFSFTVNQEPYDIRLSIIPTAFGESAVMRLLPQNAKLIDLQNLGLLETDREILASAVKASHGLILNTGPTGSGKTTTLYALLKTVNKPTVKIFTLEDPIEYRLPGVSQSQVNPEGGISFIQGLRAILRQDPDIILIGEIRDETSAQTAIQASLTGHLVLSTLHTNNAVGTIPRLRELKVKDNLLAESLKVIIAQRLVRRPCPSCKKIPHLLGPEEKKLVEKWWAAIPENLKRKLHLQLPKQFTKPEGCPECGGIGYKGRLGVFEVLQNTPSIQNAILTHQTLEEIERRALQQGMTPLAADGLIKVLLGQTTLEELLRITRE